ncbi:MAG: ATP-binding protein [Fimbriimonadales bacterium]|nr:ATP-binding protein [Fimbriimonadales bacterium]
MGDFTGASIGAGTEDVGALRRLLEEALQREQDLRKKLEELESKTQKPEGAARPPQSLRGPVESSVEVAPINEADVTLRRLVQRVAMILQADRIVIMFHDRETGELIGIPPAYGIDEDRLSMFRVRATQGISGQVFREGTPVIFHDAMNDPRTQKDPFSILGVQNGITVPLVIEKRDEENRVIERTVIGVLHAFNKRHGEDFNEEDVRLLERMARNVGSIIANLQLYREVVEEREELLQTFESLTAGLILVSPESRISQMNNSARTIFGASPDVVGKPYTDVINNDIVRDVFERTTKGEDTGTTEVPITIAGVERTYQVQAAQVRNEDGKDLGVVAILNDITEMKNIERMKSSFVAMASHELRTPLTAIKGFVSTLLMDDGFSAEERREFYQIMDQECDRLTRLIADLLNTARIEAGESLKPNYTRVDYRRLLEKVLAIQRQATSKHNLILDAPEELPSVIGDEDKLDQILTNLLNNAIKYSPNGGDIVLSARIEGDQMVTSVQDSGLGIPPDHIGKVFEKFHRVNNEDNRKIYGTGLGLFLVKHLVESIHLGKIWVDWSEVGKGSRFTFTFPLELDIEKAKELNS